MTTLRREDVAAHLKQLPSLPNVVAELLSSFSAEDVDVDLIARQIARDQALTARVLRVANSSFYGLQHRVGTIQEAVTVLGFRAVRSMVLAVGMSGAFRHDKCPEFDAKIYLRHGVGTALAARVLATQIDVNPDLAFTAGLLHDIGQLVLVAHFPEPYAQVLTYRRQHDCFLIQAERDVLGIDHTEVGAMLADAWHFPAILREAVADHHAPASAAGNSLANLIHVADLTAHALGFTQSDEEQVAPLDRTAWERLGGDWVAYAKALPEIEAGFEEACQAISL